MTRRAMILPVVLALTGDLGTAAAQQPFCAARSEIVEALRNRYGESRRGAGLQSESALFELFASPETGSWTVLITRPDGQSCAVAAGQAWRDDEPDHSGRPDA